MIGMQCQRCESFNVKVINTTAVENGIRRRRACLDCGRRWNTFEYSEGQNQELDRQRDQVAQAAAEARYTIQAAIEKLKSIKV